MGQWRVARSGARIVALALFAGALATGCSGGEHAVPGVTANGTLGACPSSPNCRCSDVTDDGHTIAPLRISDEPAAAWAELKTYLAQTPRMKFVAETDDYLHVEATTRLMRFTDDVEFHLRPADGIIAMRSASRVGRSDFGANAKRLEAVRAALVAKGVVSGN